MVEALMVPPSAMWSTMVMHTHPFTQDLLQNVRPHHEVILSCKPHRPGCHQWRPLHSQVHDDIRELKPDVIVERYLDAKYYQYAPEDIQEMSDYNSNATYLAESDQIVTLTAMETDDPSMLASLQDNLQELVNSVPEWEKETQSIHPKWLEHHQSGHLVKDPGCPVCMEEAGSKVNHRRKKVTGIQVLCIVILQHLKHQQMVTSIVWLQQSLSKLIMCRSCYHSLFQCLRRMQYVPQQR